MDFLAIDFKKKRTKYVSIKPVLNFEFIHLDVIIFLTVKRTKEQTRKDIFNFVKANGVMTLATQSNRGPWVCTVYYGIDKDMNMYLVTDPRTAHAKNFVKDSRVAFNIYDSHQKIIKLKRGVQGFGICEIVKGVLANTKALFLWHKQNPGIEKAITIKDIFKKLTDTKIYKITPKYLKFFNQELYPSEEWNGIEL